MMPGRLINKAKQEETKRKQLETPREGDPPVSSYHCCILTNSYQSFDFVSVYKLCSTVYFRETVP
jgi:hypothetical protein